MSQNDRYPRRLQFLHWSIAALIVVQLLLAGINANVYERHPGLSELAIQIHIQLGFVIFCFTVFRIAFRLRATVMPIPDEPVAIRYLRRTVHFSLYGTVLALLATGYAKLSSAGFDMTVLGLVALPALPFDPQVAMAAQDAHRVAGWCFMGVVAIHLSGAVLHRRLFGNDVLSRMGFSLGFRDRG